MALQAKLPSAYTCLGSTLDDWNFLVPKETFLFCFPLFRLIYSKKVDFLF